MFLTWKVLQTFMTKMKLWLHDSAEPESVAEWETRKRSSMSAFTGGDSSG